MKIELKTKSKKLLADTLTPVNIYLKLRDIFAGSILLESSDYHGHENSLSFICCEPIATFQVSEDAIEIGLPGRKKATEKITSKNQVLEFLDGFRNAFQSEETHTKFA